MRILALDLGKYKTVACDYEAETGEHRFARIHSSLITHLIHHPLLIVVKPLSAPELNQYLNLLHQLHICQ